MTLRPLRTAALVLLVTALLAHRANAQAFEPVGTPIGGGDDVLIGPLDIGFPFRFPNGLQTSFLEISTNGRIFPAGQGTVDASETEFDLIAQNQSICMYGDDLVEQQVHFATNLADHAVITFPDATEFGLNVPFTMQIQLDATGSFRIVWDHRTAGLTGDAIAGTSVGGSVHKSTSTMRRAIWCR